MNKSVSSSVDVETVMSVVSCKNYGKPGKLPKKNQTILPRMKIKPELTINLKCKSVQHERRDSQGLSHVVLCFFTLQFISSKCFVDMP